METRSDKQNRALHLFYTMLSDELNSAGLDQRVVLKPSIDIPWNLESVKNQLWRPIQKAITGKESTTELTTDEIDKVYAILMKHMNEKFKIECNFPSEEERELETKTFRKDQD